jgi:hypothetical protein
VTYPTIAAIAASCRKRSHTHASRRIIARACRDPGVRWVESPRKRGVKRKCVGIPSYLP